MTKQQKKLLDFIRKYIKKHEISPTYREMAKALNNKSIADIGRKLDSLVFENKIKKRIPARARDVKLL